MLVTEKAKVFSIPLETNSIVKKTGNIKWYKSFKSPPLFLSRSAFIYKY